MPSQAANEVRATLTSVAKAAAVSRQTVSNVLNAPHRVREETRRRVEAVIAETVSRPLRPAQTLPPRRSHLIAVIIPAPAERHGELHNAFLHAMAASAQHAGYRGLLYTAAGEDY